MESRPLADTAMRWIALVLGMILVAGCTNPRFDSYIELLNAEKRALEDELYDLTYEYETQHKRLQRLADQNRKLQRSLDGSGADGGPRIEIPPAETRAAPMRVEELDVQEPPELIPAPRTTRPRDNRPDLPDVPLPGDSSDASDADSSSTRAHALAVAPDYDVQPAVHQHESQPVVSSPPPRPSGAGDHASLPTEAASSSDIQDEPTAEGVVREPNFWDDVRPPEAAAVAEAVVKQVWIDPSASRGEDFDQQPGDDGIRLLLQPRDGLGRYAPVAGRVRVALFDGQNIRREKVVAMWEFSPQEVAQRMQGSGEGRSGVHLRMVWNPDQRPQHGLARVLVRWETADGSIIDAHADLSLNVAAARQTQWQSRPNPPTTHGEAPQWSPSRSGTSER